MAFLKYRGSKPSTSWTVDATGSQLSNSDIDTNFYSLDAAKFEKSGGTISGDVTITGNLTLNGTTTTINTTTLNVDDKNIELGAVDSPTNTTADGGGITLKGSTDKTIIWDSANTNWTSSENWNIASGKTYKINNIEVLSSNKVQQLSYTSIYPNSVLISGYDRTANVVTITTASAHGFAVNDTVTVIPENAYADFWGAVDVTITAVPTSTTFKYAQTGSSAASGSGGYVTKGSQTSFVLRDSQNDIRLGRYIYGQYFVGQWRGVSIPAGYGGTGQTGYATGDLLYASSTSALSRLAKGTDGQILTLSSGLPTWSNSTGITSLGTVGTGTWQASIIANAYGGTGFGTYAAGDILYASATNTLSKLAKGSDGQVLKLSGGLPAWGTDNDTTYSNGTGLNLVSGSFSVKYGSTAGTACEGNDSRLSDARAPTAHNHDAGNINAGQLAFARLPAVYLGTTAIQSSSGNQAVTGISSITYPNGSTGTATSIDRMIINGGFYANEYYQIRAQDGTGNIAGQRFGWDGANGRIDFGQFYGASQGGTDSSRSTAWPINMVGTGSNQAYFKVDGSIKTQIYYPLSSTDYWLDLATTATSLNARGSATFGSNVTAGGTVTANSDARLKTNVQTIQNALDSTLKLRGVTYTKDGQDSIGVIAQEVREIFPELVLEANDKDKTLSVAYANMVGVLIEAIKELNAKVEDLQNQIANK